MATIATAFAKNCKLAQSRIVQCNKLQHIVNSADLTGFLYAKPANDKIHFLRNDAVALPDLFDHRILPDASDNCSQTRIKLCKNGLVIHP